MQRVRRALKQFDVTEPANPSRVEDGVRELQRCHRALDAVIKGTAAESLVAPDLTPPIELGRRGTERLLKLLVFFLNDSGCSEVLRRVVTDGLHDFTASPGAVDRWDSWLHDCDLGTFNYLLRGLSLELQATGANPPFVVGPELWSKAAFGPINSLAGALKPAVHDVQTSSRYTDDPGAIAKRQFKAIDGVLSRLDDSIWRPRAVQFFRRVHDGHSVHHEAYDENGQHIWFFETETEFMLHTPYLFRAASNPAAIDVSCVMARSEFFRSV